MQLTAEQKAILDGAKGETMAKVMKTMVMYGDAFEAEKLVPITSKYNHLVTSFGLKVMSPVYDLMQQLLDSGVMSGQKFSVDPRPVDKNVPANLLQNLVFNKLMYSKQKSYEGQLKELGLMNDDAFTCTCYMDEVGNKPQKVRFCHGQSRLPWFMPTRFWVQGATAIRVLLILWALLSATFLISVCLPTREERLPGL